MSGRIGKIACPCGSPLSEAGYRKALKGQGSGLCRPCWIARVKIERACSECSAKITARAYQGRCKLCSNRHLAKDADREQRRLKAMREALARPEVRANRLRVNRMIGDRKMSWCPPEYRADYFRLLKKHGQHAAARAEIEARLSSFERQMLRVLSGKARVVTKEIILRPDPSMTLGGVSAGWFQ